MYSHTSGKRYVSSGIPGCFLGCFLAWGGLFRYHWWTTVEARKAFSVLQLTDSLYTKVGIRRNLSRFCGAKASFLSSLQCSWVETEAGRASVYDHLANSISGSAWPEPPVRDDSRCFTIGFVSSEGTSREGNQHIASCKPIFGLHYKPWWLFIHFRKLRGECQDISDWEQKANLKSMDHSMVQKRQ